jgi:hypothetical protein
MSTELATNLNIDLGALGYQDVVREVEEAVGSNYRSARAYFEDDFWQKGEGWVGPHPGENEDAGEVWADIEAHLVPHPGVEEIVNRHRDAVIGQEPFWRVVPRRAIPKGEEPTEEEQNIMKEIHALLTQWWDSKEPLEVLQQAVEDLCLGGRGLIRLFIPAGDLQVDADDVTFVPEGDIAEQLDRIWSTFVQADAGAVPRDPMTMRKFGIMLYEVQDLKTNATVKLAELTYVDPTTKETVIRTVAETGGDIKVPEEFKGNLGGRLTMYEMRSRPIVTAPIIGNLRLLVKSLTMRSNNIDLGGFLERTILNGQLPGHWETDNDGVRSWVEDKFILGAGTTNKITGVQTGVKEDGNAILAEPRIQYKDPVNVECFDKSGLAAYKNILTGARQLHVLISGDANASGEARKQARDDFTKSLKRTKTRLDAAGRWLLETVLQIACTLAGTPDKYKKFRVVFDSQLDPGPLSADDRAAIVSEVTCTPPLRSQEGGMALLGIEDTDAELQQISVEESARAATMTPLQKQQLERGALGVEADKLALQQRRTGGAGNHPPASS